MCVCLLLYFFLHIRWLRSFCHHLSHPSMRCQSKTNEIEPAVAEENNNTHKPKQIQTQTRTHKQTNKNPFLKHHPMLSFWYHALSAAFPSSWHGVWDKKHFISTLRSNNMPSFLNVAQFFYPTKVLFKVEPVFFVVTKLKTWFCPRHLQLLGPVCPFRAQGRPLVGIHAPLVEEKL